MKIVKDKITLEELRKMANLSFGNLVKAVLDIERKTMVVDAELHADQESLLLEKGSKQEGLWGINLYPDEYGTDNFVEFDSMINIRPSQGNVTRGVDNEPIREKIIAIVNSLVTDEIS